MSAIRNKYLFTGSSFKKNFFRGKIGLKVCTVVAFRKVLLVNVAINHS